MNPYSSLSKNAFWRTAVATQDMWSIKGLWTPGFDICDKTKIVTVGSCFARRIGRVLRAAGYNWLETEPAPHYLPTDQRERYGYGQFSFRTGNIYTAALLRQWLSWAIHESFPSDEIWCENERYYDPFRPTIEPNGFDSRDELLQLRDQTLRCIKQAITEADLWIITLGLTEGWWNSCTRNWYPMCPGTVAGQFVSDIHEFCNLSYAQNRDTMTSIINIITHYKPQAKFLLTVSPIPLVATASDDHVLVATEYSKSTLRAMAGDIANSMRGVVEYFPSYEIITSHPYRGVFFDQNMRTVSPYGVGFVMKHFFSALSVHSRGAKIDKRPHVDGSIKDKLVGGFEGTDSECEQLVLDGFSGMSP